MKEFILDDRHQIFSIFGSDCGNCRHYKNGYSCPAFPNGNIPDDLLAGLELHDAVLENQTGKIVFDGKKEREWWTQKRKEFVINNRKKFSEP
jgi:hypothetical protein